MEILPEIDENEIDRVDGMISRAPPAKKLRERATVTINPFRRAVEQRNRIIPFRILRGCARETGHETGFRSVPEVPA